MPVVVILPRSLVSLIPGTARSTEVEATTVREVSDRHRTSLRRIFRRRGIGPVE